MKYFSIKELCKSSTAKKLNIDNTPSAEIKEKLTVLIEECLDPIREVFGGPIMVTSGYRCPQLNVACGGSPTSEHQEGRAADIDTSDNLRLWEVITSGDFKWTQLINEYPDEDGEPSWIHISYDPDNLKCEKLICKNGKYYKC
jgi:hypothetical protein